MEINISLLNRNLEKLAYLPNLMWLIKQVFVYPSGHSVANLNLSERLNQHFPFGSHPSVWLMDRQ